MGSHAKPRTTGRKTALSALALGATLTGIGLTAAALDPATAVLTASGTDGDGTTQLSGLSTPVSLDLSPAADSITDLTAAPFQPGSTVSALTGSGAGYASPATGTPESAGSVRRTTTTATSGSSGTGSSGGASTGSGGGSTGTGTSTGSGSSSSGSSSGGGTGSGTPPTDLSGITSAIQSAVGSTVAATTAKVLPTVDNLVSKVPVVSSLLQGTGVLDAASSAESAATGSGSAAADPVSGLVGSVPLVGTLLGGTGDGQSTVTVPGLSTLSGLL